MANRVKTVSEAREIWRRNGLAFGSSLPDYLFENAEALLKLEDKAEAARTEALTQAANIARGPIPRLGDVASEHGDAIAEAIAALHPVDAKTDAVAKIVGEREANND